jgi:hypothetical protein
MQVFVKWSGNRVFYRGFHRMRCETGTKPLAEPRALGMAKMRNTCACCDARKGTLSDSTLFPVPSIGVA